MNNVDVQEIMRVSKIGWDDETPRPLTAREFFLVSSLGGHNQINPDYVFLMRQFASWIKETFNPLTCVEIGCGPGELLASLIDLGVNATGCDVNKFSKALFDRIYPNYRSQYFIAQLPPASTHFSLDLALSIEVLEHLNDTQLQLFFDHLRLNLRPNYFIFSSTPHWSENRDFDVQWGHINIKSQTDWDILFSGAGYMPIEGVIPPITEWARIYELRQSGVTR